MTDFSNELSRRAVLIALAAGAAALPFMRLAHAAGFPGIGAGGFGTLLNHASDSALNKLGVPGAFYGDPVVRIGLPTGGSSSGGGLGGMLGGVMSAGSKFGLTDGLTHKLNQAAGVAALQAKPVFHTAISHLSLSDAPGIIGKSDGATQYLHTSAGPDLHHKLRPMIDDALSQVGAFRMLESNTQLSALIGAGRDKLGESVTRQALNGIFTYIAAEERHLRANPMGPAGSVLKGMF
ncbi:DUF4197 domain-containing protein [Novosphingobium sp.]|uniref:DUF4197 domain-containing protein n=1 Tax=Novosphingobium sp. TaxID=1874826 RepID=UPI003B52C16A